jgi:hypothetical protein
MFSLSLQIYLANDAKSVVIFYVIYDCVSDPESRIYGCADACVLCDSVMCRVSILHTYVQGRVYIHTYSM